MPTVSLPSKPSAELFYEHITSASSNISIIFINGLVAPAMSWKPVIGYLENKASTLIYDRFGQGATSARDPLDAEEGKPVGLGHTYIDVVKDLHELIHHVILNQTHQRLVLVGNSIGVNIARLYTHLYPDEVAGALFLDSNIANKEFHDIWPNPKDPNFDAASVLGGDVTLEQYEEICLRLPGMFNSSVPTPEGLDRRNQKELLPQPDEPKLLGSDGRGIHLTVVGHDPEVFASQSAAMMKVPPSLTHKLTEPAWNTYNQGLAKLSPRSTGPLVATGAGHFVQKDQPRFVAEKIDELVRNIERGS